MNKKPKLDDQSIRMRYESGESTNAIGQSLGVSHATIARRLRAAGVFVRPRNDIRYSDRHIPPAANISKHKIERLIADLLRKGSRYTAKQIGEAIGTSSQIWEVLIQMEKDILVYRAAVHGDWRTFDSWKMTGCGMLVVAVPR